MIGTLRTAIYSKCASTFSNKFYFLEAPSNTKYPYAVVSQLPSNIQRDSVSKFEFVEIQINGYDKTLTSLETLEATLIGLLDKQQSTFTLTDYYVIDIDHTFSRTAKIDVLPEGVFMFTHQYRFHLQKK